MIKSVENPVEILNFVQSGKRREFEKLFWFDQHSAASLSNPALWHKSTIRVKRAQLFFTGLFGNFFNMGGWGSLLNSQNFCKSQFWLVCQIHFEVLWHESTIRVKRAQFKLSSNCKSPGNTRMDLRVSDSQSIVSFFGFKPGLLLLKIQLPGILKTSGGPHNEEHLDPLALQNLSINGHRAVGSRGARIKSARKLRCD